MGGLDKLSISLSPQQGIMLGAMLVALSFLYSSIIALISVFAKSTKRQARTCACVYAGFDRRAVHHVYVRRTQPDDLFHPILQ